MSEVQPPPILVRSLNPYAQLDSSAFWKTAVAERTALEIEGLWRPKWQIGRHERIATAGSCFAQHISKALVRHGFNWFDGEPAPADLAAEHAKRQNYGIFSFRTGNIYTTVALRQWVAWAFGTEPAPEECWERDGRFYDPFRPAIREGGFDSAKEVAASRQETLSAIRHVLATTDVFVFTLGLTEAWRDKHTDLVYAMCPGTVAGEFDSTRHEFVNFTAAQVSDALAKTFECIKAVNPSIRFLLTVSPVPLVATASGQHVLVATSFSKAVLRCVAGECAADRADTDYFPSYEIISSVPFKGVFFDSNLRTVSGDGVDFVMASFFSSLSTEIIKVGMQVATPTVEDDVASIMNDLGLGGEEEDAVVCEEEMLKAFAPKS